MGSGTCSPGLRAAFGRSVKPCVSLVISLQRLNMNRNRNNSRVGTKRIAPRHGTWSLFSRCPPWTTPDYVARICSTGWLLRSHGCGSAMSRYFGARVLSAVQQIRAHRYDIGRETCQLIVRDAHRFDSGACLFYYTSGQFIPMTIGDSFVLDTINMHSISATSTR